MSHPVWVRGLKPQVNARWLLLGEVAPRVGAWIETDICVNKTIQNVLHPVWVRGLKPL